MVNGYSVSFYNNCTAIYYVATVCTQICFVSGTVGDCPVPTVPPVPAIAIVPCIIVDNIPSVFLVVVIFFLVVVGVDRYYSCSLNCPSCLYHIIIYWGVMDCLYNLSLRLSPNNHHSILGAPHIYYMC